MGYTAFTLRNIDLLIKQRGIKSVLDFGAQNNYAQPNLPAPYMSEWYKEKGIIYESIDLSGENGCVVQDLTEKFDLWANFKFDLCVDAGTLEHVSNLHAGLKNLFNHCKDGGYIYRENPKTGNWPGHGFNYMTEAFYIELQGITDIEIVRLGEHAAMGNYIDGWNIYCLMIKNGSKFPTFNQFKKLPIYKK
jgi:hypothetical protein